MASIFNKIKARLGMTSAQPESRGHVLGTRESNATAKATESSTDGAKVIEICFTEPSMGMQIESAAGGLPVVTAVMSGSAAERLKVKPQDLVIAIDNLEIQSFEQCMEILTSAGRPINLRFLRTGEAFVKGPKPSAVPLKPPSSSSRSALTPEEREIQRKNLEEAAKRRGEAWDKKLEKTRSKKKEDERGRFEDSSASEDALNPETAKSIEAAKRREAEVVRQMGYSPFRPHMSFSSGGANANDGSVSVEARPSAPPLQETLPADEAALLNERIDEALALLLSLASSESTAVGAEEAVQQAISTALKMLASLDKNPLDPKLRSIRVHNPAFYSRVGGVPGGKELFECGGFVSEWDEDKQEEFLKYPAVSGAGGAEQQALRLRHVIARLAEFQV